jgi:hypothetical protein
MKAGDKFVLKNLKSDFDGITGKIVSKSLSAKDCFLVNLDYFDFDHKILVNKKEDIDDEIKCQAVKSKHYTEEDFKKIKIMPKKYLHILNKFTVDEVIKHIKEKY